MGKHLSRALQFSILHLTEKITAEEGGLLEPVLSNVLINRFADVCETIKDLLKLAPSTLLESVVVLRGVFAQYLSLSMEH
jgi:hypothetical protein